jgi:hypothetical protein
MASFQLQTKKSTKKYQSQISVSVLQSLKCILKHVLFLKIYILFRYIVSKPVTLRCIDPL